MDGVAEILNKIYELETKHGSALNTCKGCEICDQIRNLGIDYEDLAIEERRSRKRASDIEVPIEETVEFTEEELKRIKKHGLTRDRVRTRILKEGWNKEEAINTPLKKMTTEEAEFYKRLAKENGIPMSTFYKRVQRGMTPQQAATEKKWRRKTG